MALRDYLAASCLTASKPSTISDRIQVQGLITLNAEELLDPIPHPFVRRLGSNYF
jgi:hypothetical protein